MRSKPLLAGLVFTILAAAGQQFRTAQPGYRFVFPQDHFDHPEFQTEWWYYTGNLRGADGKPYGFELTFFRQAQSIAPAVRSAMTSAWIPDQVYLAHFAVSDIDGQHFYHAERLNRAGPGLAGASLEQRRYWNGNWQVQWDPSLRGVQHLQAMEQSFAVDVTLTPAKPFVIQGENGVDRKGADPSAASHYISFTRLQVGGDLTIDGKKTRVEGLAWMDHEFFTEPPSPELAGWDWFAIQLDNGEDLMLYRLRLRSGAPDPYSSGTWIDKEGKSRHLRAGDFVLTPSGEWRSPHSRARYPATWTLSVPSLRLELKSSTGLADQELWTAEGVTPAYWEGAVRFNGTEGGLPVQGTGYLEMTGYEKAVNLSGTNQR
jgi:predicted secreted hydrolase